MDSGSYGIERIRCEIGASIKHTDKSEWLREYKGVRSEDEALERRLERVFEGSLTGRVLHDTSMPLSVFEH